MYRNAIGSDPVIRCNVTGWVDIVDGHSCVVCPYHGWAFDTEGYVRDVPASENRVYLLPVLQVDDLRAATL